ncbi:unnamed protein product [Bathycoccus prasinos]
MSPGQEKILSPSVHRNFQRIGLAEYDGFPDVDQILVEVHAFTHLQQLNKAGSVVQNPSQLRMRLDRLFEVLEAVGFRLYHKEINVLWSRPMYSNMGVEYAFIRVSV